MNWKFTVLQFIKRIEIRMTQQKQLFKKDITINILLFLYF